MIVQPYVPTYRVPFFDALVRQLSLAGVTCQIAAGAPAGQQALRNDAATAPWKVDVPRKEFRVGDRALVLGGARSAWRDADAVIVPAQGTSIDTYRAIFDRRRRLKVGLWGHLRDYVGRSHPLDSALERWQLRNADHVFGYTQSGVDYVVQQGVPAERTTAVMNTIDTSKLESALAMVTDKDVNSFLARHGITKGKVLAYVGGLDSSKRIPFLCEALDQLHESQPEVKVVVAGRGADEGLLQRHVDRKQVIMLGYAGPETKALIGRTASALLVPGRIGLVAVDALAMRLPIVTTNFPFHAPEVDYLTEGVTRFTSAGDPVDYVRIIQRLLNSETGSTAQAGTWDYPRLHSMVNNFASGVMKLLKG